MLFAFGAGQKPVESQRPGVDFNGWMRFFAREKPRVMPAYAGVGRTAVASLCRYLPPRASAVSAQEWCMHPIFCVQVAGMKLANGCC
ncbi:hypothetical protein D3C72_2092410 [compost metagenome]